MLTQLSYPTEFGPNVQPQHRDNLEFYTWRHGDSFWFQKDNWWNQNHKTSKSPWQYWNTRSFRKLLNNREGAIIDVGANVGMTSVQFARWGYNVLAFEPSIQTCELLRHNLAINGVADKVTVYQNGVSDCSYTAILRDQHNYAGVSVLVKCVTGRAVKSDHHDVDAVALDDLVLPKIAGVKIDTEGHEFAVLQGAVNLITRDRPVFLVELLAASNTSANVKKYDWAPQDVFDFFGRYDYVAYNKDLVPHKEWKPKRNYSDYIFVPRESDPLANPIFNWGV